MQRPDVFTGLGIAVFSLAAYQDGSWWISGFCAGSAGIILVDCLAGFAAKRDALKEGGENA